MLIILLQMKENKEFLLINYLKKKEFYKKAQQERPLKGGSKKRHKKSLKWSLKRGQKRRYFNGLCIKILFFKLKFMFLNSIYILMLDW